MSCNLEASTFNFVVLQAHEMITACDVRLVTFEQVILNSSK
jgi:hypothetical protein